MHCATKKKKKTALINVFEIIRTPVDFGHHKTKFIEDEKTQSLGPLLEEWMKKWIINISDQQKCITLVYI